MKKSDAIDQAVTLELEKEVGATPQTYKETMGPTYGYDTTSIQIFLKAVAKRLKGGGPSYSFDWKALDFNKSVASSVSDLEIAIAGKTKLA